MFYTAYSEALGLKKKIICEKNDRKSTFHVLNFNVEDKQLFP